MCSDGLLTCTLPWHTHIIMTTQVKPPSKHRLMAFFRCYPPGSTQLIWPNLYKNMFSKQAGTTAAVHCGPPLKLQSLPDILIMKVFMLNYIMYTLTQGNCRASLHYYGMFISGGADCDYSRYCLLNLKLSSIWLWLKWRNKGPRYHTACCCVIKTPSGRDNGKIIFLHLWNSVHVSVPAQFDLLGLQIFQHLLMIRFKT